jgi:hypothetical protein
MVIHALIFVKRMFHLKEALMKQSLLEWSSDEYSCDMLEARLQATRLCPSKAENAILI